MGPDLGIGDAAYRFRAGIFFISYALCASLAICCWRVSAPLLIARIMITWGLISAARCSSPAPPASTCVAIPLGAAEADSFQASLLSQPLVSALAPRQRRFLVHDRIPLSVVSSAARWRRIMQSMDEYMACTAGSYVRHRRTARRGPRHRVLWYLTDHHRCPLVIRGATRLAQQAHRIRTTGSACQTWRSCAPRCCISTLCCWPS